MEGHFIAGMEEGSGGDGWQGRKADAGDAGEGILEAGGFEGELLFIGKGAPKAAAAAAVRAAEGAYPIRGGGKDFDGLGLPEGFFAAGDTRAHGISGEGMADEDDEAAFAGDGAAVVGGGEGGADQLFHGVLSLEKGASDATPLGEFSKNQPRIMRRACLIRARFLS